MTGHIIHILGTLRSGIEVAVKTLSAQSKQGVPEFLNEIKTISKVKHPNLVELIGCCVQGTNRILVYEYVENNSLDRALLGNVNSNYILKAEIWLFPIMARQKCTIICYPFQAWTLHEEGKPLELVDPEMGEFPVEEVIRYIKVAFFCTQSAANRRPLMTQVVDMLSKQIQLNDKQLTAPGFFQDSDSHSGGASSTNVASTGNQMSSVPVKITEVIPR
ncbi:hypothetical protein SADUNF_Sadunf11G0029500 [Salix dunnii]|uniref:Protein kinase domain-containing protein n=1 Tax=Salix dunnii TaxID=1413687 RepID=A0A835JPR6_9ROSI|nr:hypothetical protein SADUNF_Sadunf11G0029500 [Salix dunnii]